MAKLWRDDVRPDRSIPLRVLVEELFLLPERVPDGEWLTDLSDISSDCVTPRLDDLPAAVLAPIKAVELVLPVVKVLRLPLSVRDSELPVLDEDDPSPLDFKLLGLSFNGDVTLLPDRLEELALFDETILGCVVDDPPFPVGEELPEFELDFAIPLLEGLEPRRELAVLLEELLVSLAELGIWLLRDETVALLLVFEELDELPVFEVPLLDFKPLLDERFDLDDSVAEPNDEAVVGVREPVLLPLPLPLQLDVVAVREAVGDDEESLEWLMVRLRLERTSRKAS